MDLHELMSCLVSAGVRVVVHGDKAKVRICDVTEDSRTVVPGSLFVARAGLKSDGRRFVGDAVRGGAVAILTDDTRLGDDVSPGVPVVCTGEVARASALIAECFYGQPASRLHIAGVTGTNGKTTISYLIWRMLNALQRRCGLVGTVLIDDGREVARAAMTTPPAIELSRTLATMVEGGCTHAAMEVSSHSLDQRRCDAIGFGVGIFTNLTGDHLDYHQTMEAYAAAKARLFEMLPPAGVALINADDPWAPRMVQDCKARIERCSAKGDADWTVRIERETLHGMDLSMHGPAGALRCRVPLIGRYNAMNVLQAVAACHAMGVSGADLSRALGAVQAPPGRLERVGHPDDPFGVYVDYAHSDDALRNVLSAVRGVLRGPGSSHLAADAGSTHGVDAGGRLWVVFGCGGDRDATKRPRMGAAASELADRVVVTSDNPRRERPGAIIDQVLAGITPSHRVKVEVQADRARAIAYAIEHAAPGDVVVIAGKGHETEQILPDDKGGTYSVRFDDREVAAEALARVRPEPEAGAPIVHARRRSARDSSGRKRREEPGA
ncbi:MAG: UDP-N-acetylmuramoyl-L-alanyl-D-glutamate--2,6-diaminopimelate ligase [Phycisphaerales bacterium]|nr:UDP-N-acetylmuramoyl-L-alanyl-D-glutamate--2,6-diaminopimelate ligase [Phycisphaerales bacterium]